MSQQVLIDTPENWDAASEGYALKIAPLLMESFASEFADLLQVNKDSEVLEVAAGSGAITFELANRVKSLLATDFAPKMLKIIQHKLHERGISNVSLQLMDGQNLELEDNSFDSAICSFGLMLFPNRKKGFEELLRVIKPGGRALVAGWSDPTKFESFGLFMEALNRALPDMPKPSSPPPLFSLADLSNFKTQMEEAGFSDVEVKYISRESSVNNANDLWEIFTVGAPPIRLLMDAIGEDGKRKLRETLTELVEERFGSGPIKLNNAATVGLGVKK